MSDPKLDQEQVQSFLAGKVFKPEGSEPTGEKKNWKSLSKTLRGCATKKRYEKPTSAKKRASEVMYEHGELLYHYECSSCGGYHLTKNKSAEGRTI